MPGPLSRTAAELAGRFIVERDIDLAAARAISYGVIQQIAHQQTEQQRLAGADDMAGSIFKMQAQLNPGLLRRVTALHLHHCRLQQIGDSDLLHTLLIQLGADACGIAVVAGPISESSRDSVSS
ncbi:hypothetical protein [Klebsiella pneumoniae]|uniref:hypothetical protein n=1 Tax=Klebsiella pneumoniae TaxID=573 RepID=UPI0039865D7D